MGTTTPNIGIFIPAAGETLYADSFTAGMINIDQHDHSGAPNKGIPIGTTGLGPASVTFDKLNINVANPATGIGTDGANPNQLILLGCLPNLFNYGFDGFITKNGDNIEARQFQDTTTIKWTNGSGAGAQGLNPSAEVLIAGLSPIDVTNGGTGVVALNAWDIVCGGNVADGPVQQVAGEGLATQVLTSNGPLALPTWQAVPYPAQNLLKATLNLTDVQVNNLFAFPIQIIPAPGPGKAIMVHDAIGKLVYGGVDEFHGGGNNFGFYYEISSSATYTGVSFFNGSFRDNFSAYYTAYGRSLSNNGIPLANVENKPIIAASANVDLTGGAGNTISISIQYSIVQI